MTLLAVLVARSTRVDAFFRPGDAVHRRVSRKWLPALAAGVCIAAVSNVHLAPAAIVTRDLFEGLAATDADGTVVPGVAEKWEQKDATTWIFHLRKNAKWSNGEPVVANDFVYGCQRLVDHKIASPSARTV